MFISHEESTDLPGLGYVAEQGRLKEAIQAVRGVAPTPFSLTGSLPLVRDLQRQGCDVRITGFGEMAYYHAPNEQARLEDFRQGFSILRELLVRLCAGGSPSGVAAGRNDGSFRRSAPYHGWERGHLRPRGRRAREER